MPRLLQKPTTFSTALGVPRVREDELYADSFYMPVMFAEFYETDPLLPLGDPHDRQWARTPLSVGVGGLEKGGRAYSPFEDERPLS